MIQRLKDLPCSLVYDCEKRWFCASHPFSHGLSHMNCNFLWCTLKLHKKYLVDSKGEMDFIFFLHPAFGLKRNGSITNPPVMEFSTEQSVEIQIIS